MKRDLLRGREVAFQALLADTEKRAGAIQSEERMITSKEEGSLSGIVS